MTIVDLYQLHEVDYGYCSVYWGTIVLHTLKCLVMIFSLYKCLQCICIKTQKVCTNINPQENTDPSKNDYFLLLDRLPLWSLDQVTSEKALALRLSTTFDKCSM